MTSTMTAKEQSVTGIFKQMANAIIAGATFEAAPSGKDSKEAYTAVKLLSSLSVAAQPRATEPQVSEPPTSENAFVITRGETIQASRLPGQSIRLGPFDLRPVDGTEMPFGRMYQAIPFDSVSRLAGFVGADQYGFYLREVPDLPEKGLRPSLNGIWIMQPDQDEFHRLAPGEAERVTPDSLIRIGGNGTEAETGLPIFVLP